MRPVMESMIGWARERSFVNPSTRAGGVTRLELCVFADNHRAITLYESLGFTASNEMLFPPFAQATSSGDADRTRMTP